MFQLPSPLDELFDDLFSEKKIRLFIKRDDLIHPVISGNKWRKLKYNMHELQQQNRKILLTVGGAYSNHLVAAACAAHTFSLESIGIVRGEELNVNSNTNLKKCVDYGMKLHFVCRNEYAKRYDKDFFLNFIKKHQLNSNEVYVVPEGGANAFAEKGCQEIISEISIPFDFVCTAAGTGATARGIYAGLQQHQKLLVFPALKAGAYAFLIHEENTRVEILTDYTFGGYAKTTPELFDFMAAFYAKHQIQLDYVYTAKMLFGIYALIQNDYFPPNTTIIALHTGGIDNGGFPK